VKFLVKLLARYMLWSFFRHHTHLTNATFLRPATKQRNPVDQRPWKWHWLPGWQRMLWKLLIVFGPGLVAWWWIDLTHDAAMVLVLFLVLAVGNVVVYAVTRRFRERKHARAVVAPLQQTVDYILKDTA
jgi:Flp pilus assembly protein TadB